MRTSCSPPWHPQGKPRFLHGATQAQPVLPVAGEVFALRKLLPQTADYDFNVHVMVRVLQQATVYPQRCMRPGAAGMIATA